TQLKNERRPGDKVNDPFAGDGKIPEGFRDSVLTSLAGTMRHRGFCVESIQAALLIENKRRCQPPLDEAQVAKIAESVGRYRPAELTRADRPLVVRAQVEL